MSTEPSPQEAARVPVVPFTYYRVRFESKAPAGGMWAAIFHDAQGRQLDADHYSGVDPSDDWVPNEFCVRARARAATMRLHFHPVDGPLDVREAAVAPIERRDVAAWADAVYATMPPLVWTPPEGRWRRLKRTMGRLKEGGRLRIVMLGDSIVNDTGNSAYDVLLERMYPGARVEVVTSVRGGTGCWFYREEGRVGEYVLDYEPDLVMIGGISHNDDGEAIRSVVRQVRRVATPDVLVMTGAFGKDRDPRLVPEWSPVVGIGGTSYRSRLLGLAGEERLEFLDLEGAWGAYLLGVEEPYAWFLRDPVHANCRGRQILARILERYFAPKP